MTIDLESRLAPGRNGKPRQYPLIVCTLTSAAENAAGATSTNPPIGCDAPPSSRKLRSTGVRRREQAHRQARSARDIDCAARQAQEDDQCDRIEHQSEDDPAC